MVPTKTHKRKALTSKKWLSLFAYFCFGVLIAAICLVAWFKVENPYFVDSDSTEESALQIDDVTDDSSEEVEVEPEKPALIDFQSIVDDWVRSVSGNKSVIIYDLDREEIVGVSNPDETYQTASIYKLFVVYEGYRRLQSGDWQGDSLTGLTGYTIEECLDLSIRRSYSPCAETLWSMIGRNSMDQIIQDDYGLSNTKLSQLNSTPHDVVEIMKMFYEHKEIRDEHLINVMKDSFLNQPITEYNWRQGLPSGFSHANVYNKVGWDYNGSYWNLYHDAAIVEFPEQNRHFIVVVMTERVPFSQIRRLGSLIEAKVLE